MSTKKKTTRSTSVQIKFLIDFMKAHPNFANGEFSGPMGHRAMMEEWEHLTVLLKAHGPDKSIEQWRHTWRDIKKRAREEGARVKRARAQTGNFPVPDLSEQSANVLSIIGTESAFGIQSLEETGIGEIMVVAANTAPHTQTSLIYTDSLANYSHTPTTHTITQPIISLTSTQSNTQPINQCQQPTALPEHPILPQPYTTHTASLHTDSMVTYTLTSTTDIITQPATTYIRTSNMQPNNQPTTTRTLPQLSSRAQRRRMLTRASDFLTAEEETRSVLRDMSNQLVINNQNTLELTRIEAAKARRRHMERDSFLAKHTSEDNASYDRVISLEKKKRAAKLAPQLLAEVTSAALADAALTLPSIDQQADQSQRPEEVDTWRYKARNYIMYVPDGATQEPSPKPELQYHNTRLKAEPFDHVRNKEAISAIARSQENSVSGKIGVDGVSITNEKTGQYSFVSTPSPRPGTGPDQSPLMTWGEIEGTPFRLDGGDTPLPAAGAGAAYKMLEGGARERIALQLAEQVAKKRRPTTPRVAPPTPSFRTNTERLASMSPAARKLAAKHLLSPRLKLTPNDMGIFHPATPKRTPTPQRRLVTPNKKVATQRPSSAGNVNNSVSLTENNLTDNLLQINVAKRTRLKAKDFFV